jgi:hypothetical protein
VGAPEGRKVVLGHVDHDFGLALVRERYDRLTGCDDLADLDPQVRHDAAGRRTQDSVLGLVAGEFKLASLGLGHRA